MIVGPSVEFTIHIARGQRGRKLVREGPAPDAPRCAGRVPRVARLLALAIQIEALVRRGEIRDFAEAAALGHITRARMSQVLALLNLAPDIQEAILFLPNVDSGRDGISERDLRPIAAVPDWSEQRARWSKLRHAPN